MSVESIDELITGLDAVDATIPPWAILMISSMKVILDQIKKYERVI